MLKLLIGCFLLFGIEASAQQATNPSQLGTAPLSADTVPVNTLTYGATLTSSFDDNAQNPNTLDQETNVVSTFQPHVLLAIERAGLSSTLLYNPSFSYSGKISSYTNNSQLIGADMTRRFTRRLSLQLREGYMLSMNPLESWQANTELPNPGILNRPNQSVVGANVRSTTNNSEADLTYLLDAHTSVGISGTFTTLEYSSIGNNAGSANDQSQNSRGWSGKAFYSHRLTAIYTVGFVYTARHLSSQNSFGEFSSLSHQMLGLFTISLKPALNFSFFAGPEISQLDDTLFQVGLPLPSNASQSSFAGGATISWQAKRSGINASYIQQVGDAGLSGGGAVGVRTVTLGAQHQLTTRSTLRLNGTYTSNSQFDPLSTTPLRDSASAGITYSQRLTDRANIDFSILRQQFLGSPGAGFGLHSHDVAAVSLSYAWNRPIGR